MSLVNRIGEVSQVAQIFYSSLTVSENRWETVGMGNGWEIAGTETPVIWSISEDDSEQLTVGHLLPDYSRTIVGPLLANGPL